MQRAGIGYDIHRLIRGRRLILGGVEIKFSRGLAGHSDGDALLHAIIDALLGAAGEGDIGEHFPDTDPKYKNISSKELLKKTLTLFKKKGFRIVNLDTIIIAEHPHLKEAKKKIRKSLARQLKVAENRINLKAKTHEGLGPLGRGEAIAAFASVMLEKRR